MGRLLLILPAPALSTGQSVHHFLTPLPPRAKVILVHHRHAAGVVLPDVSGKTYDAGSCQQFTRGVKGLSHDVPVDCSGGALGLQPLVGEVAVGVGHKKRRSIGDGDVANLHRRESPIPLANRGGTGDTSAIERFLISVTHAAGHEARSGQTHPRSRRPPQELPAAESISPYRPRNTGHQLPKISKILIHTQDTLPISPVTATDVNYRYFIYLLNFRADPTTLR